MSSFSDTIKEITTEVTDAMAVVQYRLEKRGLTVLRSEMHGKALPLDDDDFDDEDDGDWEIIYTREE